MRAPEAQVHQLEAALGQPRSDLPFELVETIRDNDEDYWDKYRTTPKAFVSLATAKRLWPSRWGTVSLLRIAEGEAASADGNAARKFAAAIDPAALGMTFLPVFL